MSTEPFKCYKITPAHDSRIDSVFVRAGDGWKEALDMVEMSMDRQFADEVPWDEIKVTIECKMLIQEEWDELESND